MIIAPAHIIIMILFMMKEPYPTYTEELWRKSIIIANLLLFVVEVFIFLLASRMQKRNTKLRTIKIMQYGVITFVLGSGIVITLIDQLVTSSITPLVLTCVLAGTFYYIRPKEAVVIYSCFYLLYCLGLRLVSLSSVHLVTNQANGIVTVAIGLSLSISNWRNFTITTLQQEQIEVQRLRLEEMAYQDPLTGLPNRRYLDQVVQRELADALRSSDELHLIIMDIDDFKHINDTFGHPSGDSVLKQLAKLLKSNIRESDVLARLGGEEFIILLKNTSFDGSIQVTEKLRKLVAEHVFLVGEDKIRITASFGLAPLTESKPSGNFYSNADQALYEAKMSGKNQVRVASISNSSANL